jgi:hypothetical protein
MTFDNLISTFGNSYAVSGSYNTVASNIISACEDLLSSDLKAGGKTFTFSGSHDFGGSISSLSSKLSENDVVGVASVISYIFQSREATIEQLTYTVKESEFQDIIILSALGGFDGEDSLYECQNYVKKFKINVQGKKIEGEEYEEDILLHGNQVMATETSPEGITYNVEKSGDLPSDANAREEIMTERIQDLEDMVDSGEVVRYDIQEYSNKTVIKTYFKILSDYSDDFNVQSIL